MKRPSASLAVILAFTIPVALFPQSTALRPHVAVAPFVNSTDDKRYSAVGAAAQETLELTLRLIGEYQVYEAAEFNPEWDLRTAAEYMWAKSLDNLIFGSITRGAQGETVIQASLFDRQSQTVTVTKQETISSLFDVFDASDRLASSVAEAFSGRHIGFGSIHLRNSGEDGDFQVTVDGTPVAAEGSTVRAVLNGKRVVEVKQARMLGQLQLAKTEVSVEEGETVEVGFSVPYLTANETIFIEDARKTVQAGWSDPAQEQSVLKTLDATIAKLGDTAYCRKLASVRKDFDDLRTQFLADAASRAAPKAITQTRSPLDMVTPGETFLAEGRTWARSYFLGGREYSSAFGFLPIVNAISAQPRLSQELQALTAAYRKKHQPDMLFFVGGLAVSLAGDVVIIVAAQATPVDQGATIIGGSVALLGLGGAFLAGITMGRDPPDAIIDRYNHETGE